MLIKNRATLAQAASKNVAAARRQRMHGARPPRLPAPRLHADAAFPLQFRLEHDTARDARDNKANPRVAKCRKIGGPQCRPADKRNPEPRREAGVARESKGSPKRPPCEMTSCHFRIAMIS